MVFSNNRLKNTLTKWTVLIALTVLLVGSAAAAPPHPGLIQQLENGEIDLPYHLEHLDKGHEKGIDQVHDRTGMLAKSTSGSLVLAPAVTGPFAASIISRALILCAFCRLTTPSSAAGIRISQGSSRTALPSAT